MREFTESRLVFRFDDDWEVEQWDAQPAYRAPGGFGSLPETSACDFVGWHRHDRTFLIEVKNFVEFHHQNRDRLDPAQLPVEVVRKVRDTLAGAVWTVGRRFDVAPFSALIDHLVDALQRVQVDKQTLSVVLWLEDRPELDAAMATVLGDSIRRELLRRFKIRKVLVTSMNLLRSAPDAIPGLSVRAV